MSFSNLPVIDLQSNLADIHEKIQLACTTTGFFYLANHGFDSIQNQMFTMAKEFFHLPLSEKLVYAPNKTSYNGYVQVGRENLDSTNTELIDEKETFKFDEKDLNDKTNLPEIFSRDKNSQMVSEF